MVTTLIPYSHGWGLSRNCSLPTQFMIILVAEGVSGADKRVSPNALARDVETLDLWHTVDGRSRGSCCIKLCRHFLDNKTKEPLCCLVVPTLSISFKNIRNSIPHRYQCSCVHWTPVTIAKISCLRTNGCGTCGSHSPKYYYNLGGKFYSVWQVEETWEHRAKLNMPAIEVQTLYDPLWKRYQNSQIQRIPQVEVRLLRLQRKQWGY